MELLRKLVERLDAHPRKRVGKTHLPDNLIEIAQYAATFGKDREIGRSSVGS